MRMVIENSKKKTNTASEIHLEVCICSKITILYIIVYIIYCKYIYIYIIQHTHLCIQNSVVFRVWFDLVGLIFWVRVSCSPGCPALYSILSLRMLYLCLHTSQVLGLQGAAPAHLQYCLSHVESVSYQLNGSL